MGRTEFNPQYQKKERKLFLELENYREQGSAVIHSWQNMPLLFSFIQGEEKMRNKDLKLHLKCFVRWG